MTTPELQASIIRNTKLALCAVADKNIVGALSLLRTATAAAQELERRNIGAPAGSIGK